MIVQVSDTKSCEVSALTYKECIYAIKKLDSTKQKEYLAIQERLKETRGVRNNEWKKALKHHNNSTNKRISIREKKLFGKGPRHNKKFWNKLGVKRRLILEEEQRKEREVNKKREIKPLSKALHSKSKY